MISMLESTKFSPDLLPQTGESKFEHWNIEFLGIKNPQEPKILKQIQQFNQSSEEDAP